MLVNTIDNRGGIVYKMELLHKKIYMKHKFFILAYTWKIFPRLFLWEKILLLKSNLFSKFSFSNLGFQIDFNMNNNAEHYNKSDLCDDVMGGFAVYYHTR